MQLSGPICFQIDKIELKIRVFMECLETSVLGTRGTKEATESCLC